MSSFKDDDNDNDGEEDEDDDDDDDFDVDDDDNDDDVVDTADNRVQVVAPPPPTIAFVDLFLHIIPPTPTILFGLLLKANVVGNNNNDCCCNENSSSTSRLSVNVGVSKRKALNDDEIIFVCLFVCLFSLSNTCTIGQYRQSSIHRLDYSRLYCLLSACLVLSW